MKKSIFAFIMCAILALTFVSPAYAAQISKIDTNLPDITVEVDSAVEKGKVKATLDGKELKVADVKSKESGSTEWIIMMDASGSIKPADFKAQKAAIKEVINSLGPDDTLKLYTFKTSMYQVLTGSESKETAISKVDAIKNDGQHTTFYEAMAKLVDESNASKADTVIPVIYSDGDNTVAKNNMKSSMEKAKAAKVPVIGIYPSDADASKLDIFKDYVGATGGKTEAFNVDKAESQLKGLKKSNASKSTIKFTATEPIAANDKAVLSIDLGDGKPITKEIKTSAWAPEGSKTTVPDKTTTPAKTTAPASTTAKTTASVSTTAKTTVATTASDKTSAPATTAEGGVTEVSTDAETTDAEKSTVSDTTTAPVEDTTIEEITTEPTTETATTEPETVPVSNPGGLPFNPIILIAIAAVVILLIVLLLLKKKKKAPIDDEDEEPVVEPEYEAPVQEEVPEEPEIPEEPEQEEPEEEEEDLDSILPPDYVPPVKEDTSELDRLEADEVLVADEEQEPEPEEEAEEEENAEPEDEDELPDAPAPEPEPEPVVVEAPKKDKKDKKAKKPKTKNKGQFQFYFED